MVSIERKLDLILLTLRELSGAVKALSDFITTGSDEPELAALTAKLKQSSDILQQTILMHPDIKVIPLEPSTKP